MRKCTRVDKHIHLDRYSNDLGKVLKVMRPDFHDVGKVLKVTHPNFDVRLGVVHGRLGVVHVRLGLCAR